jgi:hypothetical protein
VPLQTGGSADGISVSAAGGQAEVTQQWAEQQAEQQAEQWKTAVADSSGRQQW